ncbi:MAG: hypothetical protein KDD70_15995, partial [Bdellovibrionales bacterium]|nr:hypothetical protein [Bdellovibrionales bacterium]
MSQSPHPPTNSSPHTRRPRVYGMVTTAASGEYTAAALDSFIESTELTQQDLFVLIVNDHHKVDVPQALQQSCRVILHEHPRSFAENANICTAIARERSSDLYFLNNDLIFTPGWAEHLAVPMPVITLPVSNQEFPYEAEDFKLLPLMTLEDYAGKEVLFRRFVAAHQAQKKGYQIVLSPPFFCIRIPLEILIEVGDFDPTFGKGGAEDNDYAIRTYLKGFAILASRQAYLIHFGGKSTWAGAESAAETRARDEAYIFRFREKWGTKLATLVLRSQLIKREPQLLNSLPKGLQSATQEGNWRPVILALAREEKIDCSPFTSPPPSVGAVYVIYDPEPWLHASYLAIYKHVQSV